MHNSKALYLVQSSSVESKNIIVYHNDLTLMAKELYDRFREADIEGFTSVVIEHFERKSPIAEALMNRISKAISN
jgi:L-threonylcarbamoyladenylate synthase